MHTLQGSKCIYISITQGCTVKWGIDRSSVWQIIRADNRHFNDYLYLCFLCDCQWNRKIQYWLWCSIHSQHYLTSQVIADQHWIIWITGLLCYFKPYELTLKKDVSFSPVRMKLFCSLVVQQRLLQCPLPGCRKVSRLWLGWVSSSLGLCADVSLWQYHWCSVDGYQSCQEAFYCSSLTADKTFAQEFYPLKVLLK